MIFLSFSSVIIIYRFEKCLIEGLSTLTGENVLQHVLACPFSGESGSDSDGEVSELEDLIDTSR